MTLFAGLSWPMPALWQCSHRWLLSHGSRAGTIVLPNSLSLSVCLSLTITCTFCCDGFYGAQDLKISHAHSLTLSLSLLSLALSLSPLSLRYMMLSVPNTGTNMNVTFNTVRGLVMADSRVQDRNTNQQQLYIADSGNNAIRVRYERACPFDSFDLCRRAVLPVHFGSVALCGLLWLSGSLALWHSLSLWLSVALCGSLWLFCSLDVIASLSSGGHRRGGLSLLGFSLRKFGTVKTTFSRSMLIRSSERTGTLPSFT